MKKTYIVSKMTAEYDEHGETMDDSLFGAQDVPKAFATMKAAKDYIEDEVAENYTGCDRYVVNDVVRRNKGGSNDGVWMVTVYYDGGFAEYQAAEVEIP